MEKQQLVLSSGNTFGKTLTCAPWEDRYVLNDLVALDKEVMKRNVTGMPGMLRSAWDEILYEKVEFRKKLYIVERLKGVEIVQKFEGSEENVIDSDFHTKDNTEDFKWQRLIKIQPCTKDQQKVWSLYWNLWTDEGGTNYGSPTEEK